MAKSKLKLWFTLITIGAIYAPAFAYFGLDTLYICEGESLQLITTPNQLTYDWIPNTAIDNPTIYNPVVSPSSTTTYIVTLEPNQEENLVSNGEFSSGNTGFYSEYTYTPQGTWMQGHYAIMTSPTQFNGGFAACNDHSDNTDNLMMVIDGATVLNENVWCQNISVYPEREYSFSSWVTNVLQAAPAILQFSINGELLGDPFTVPGVCEWEEFFSTWYSSSYTQAEICITNQNTIASGNDFALDDIFFTFENTRSVDTFVVVVIENIEIQKDTILCENLSFEFDGVQVPADTVMEFTFQNYQGCDSVIVWNVGAIDTFYFETRIDTLCPGDMIVYEGATITRDTQICEIFVGAFGCDSTYCFVAYFLSENTIDIDATFPSCAGDMDGSVEAQPFAGLPPYSYEWEDGSSDASRNNLAAGTYIVTVTDAKGCIAIKPFDLENPPPIEFDAEVLMPSCFGYEDGMVSFEISGGAPDYLLDFNNEGLGENLLFDSLSANSYPIYIEDGNDCFIDTFFILEEPPAIQVILSPDTSIQLGEEVQLDATIVSSLPYQIAWSPSNGLDCTDCEDPFTNTYDNQAYELLVFDENGCFTTNTVNVNVEKNYEVYIPNAFSPNQDGINDYFEIYAGRDVTLITTVRIYNRWGSLMFEGLNCPPEGAECRWDGSYKNGKMNPGVYAYYVEVQFLDGTSKLFKGDLFISK